VIYSYDKSQSDALFLNFVCVVTTWAVVNPPMSPIL